MDDATRRTWSRVFLTLGATLAVGGFVRWARWDSSGGSGHHPQVLWTLGCFAVGFLLVSIQLLVPIWARGWSDSQAEQANEDAGGNYWATGD